jgi:hypothetical protein
MEKCYRHRGRKFAYLTTSIRRVHPDLRMPSRGLKRDERLDLVGAYVTALSTLGVPSAIAAAPPILLFLAFESLLRQLGPERPAAPAKRKPQPKVLPLPSKALPVASNIEAGAKRAKALELAKEGLSQAAVARELGVSAATVSRWLGKGSKVA